MEIGGKKNYKAVSEFHCNENKKCRRFMVTKALKKENLTAL